MAEDDGGQVQLQALKEEVEGLRRDSRQLRIGFGGITIVLLGVLFIQMLWTPKNIVEASPDSNGVMRVRGLIVEDANGTERLRLGAPLPDPMMADGIRHARKGAISGMIISDAKGIERGGYVTDDQYDEAFITLDSHKGQELLILANPGGGTNLDMFDRLGNEAALTVFPNGPKFVLKKGKRVVAQFPSK